MKRYLGVRLSEEAVQLAKVAAALRSVKVNEWVENAIEDKATREGVDTDLLNRLRQQQTVEEGKPE